MDDEAISDSLIHIKSRLLRFACNDSQNPFTVSSKSSDRAGDVCESWCVMVCFSPRLLPYYFLSRILPTKSFALEILIQRFWEKTISSIVSGTIM